MHFIWPEKKINVDSSGLWQGMVEIHSHLLSGVDDGVRTIGEALDLLHFMEEEVGVEKIYMTPHTMIDFNSGPASLLLDKFNWFCREYSGGIDITIASEYMLDVAFRERLASGDILSLGRLANKSLLLVETSCMIRLPCLDDIIDDIFASGYIPVIAHPERYVYMNEGQYRNLWGKGCLLQMNIPSLYGYYGEIVRKQAEFLLDRGMFYFAGFDIHNYASYSKVIKELRVSRSRLEKLGQLLENNKLIKKSHSCPLKRGQLKIK